VPALDTNVLFAVSSGPPSPIAVLGAAAALGYVLVFLRARRHGAPLPVWRMVMFLLGCLVMVITTATGIQTYARELFAAFMFQQLSLMLIAPPLLILGSPGTVMLRGLPRHGLGLVALRLHIGGLRSPVSHALLHPLAVIPLLVLPLFGFYLSGIADLALSTDAGRSITQLAFLISGVLVMTPLVSTELLPRRTSYLIRVVDAFLEMQIHAAFGLTLIFNGPLVSAFSSPPEGLGVDALRDQQLAGALVWTYGELPVLVILLASLIRWSRQDTRRADRATRRADNEGDADLERYNAYLQSLNSDRSDRA
jgi:putative membrane protein